MAMPASEDAIGGQRQSSPELHSSGNKDTLWYVGGLREVLL